MSEILAALPKREDLAAAMPDTFETGGIDGLDGDVLELTTDIDGATPDAGQDTSLEVAVPVDLSPDSVNSRLSEPIATLGSVSADGISQTIQSEPIGIEAPTPDFDINTPMSAISNSLAPSGQVTTPTVEEEIPGFDSNAATLQLTKLAAAGQATPMRMVNMYLKVFNSFIDQATDQERILELAAESLEEIYLGQIQKLQYNLPYKVLQDLVTLLGSDFLTQYSNLLDDLEQSTTIDFNLLEKAKTEIIPSLVEISRGHKTLTNFANASIEDLQNAIDHVLDFTGQHEVVLQSFFDDFEDKVLTMLDAIEPPLDEIKAMSEKIVTFLNDTADKAEEAANKITDTLTSKLESLDDLISGDLTLKIEAINEQIDTFLKEVGTKADTAVNGVKNGLSSVTDGVESFFEKVNELKAKLEEAVDKLASEVDAKTEEAFKQAEQKIRMLLAKISEVLESPSIQDALDQTKEGIDKFKKVMEEVSLQPVFDTVVTKTGEMEVKVRAIQVDEMGVPQKTALKLGAKVIQEVKVDEIIKPELVAIFQELRDPIAALVEELKKGVLQINALIEEFAPGTIVKGLVENAGPYKDFIDILEKYKPSFLLQPLEAANAELTELVETLDPAILIEKVQGLFDELRSLADILSPNQLNTSIMNAVGKATGELRSIRDVKLDELITTIKDTISLQKILENTGIADIADLEIWRHINYYLDGVFLDKITNALSYLESELPDRIKSIEFTHHEAEVARMNELVDLQIKWTTTELRAALTNVRSLLTNNNDRIQNLESKRKQLLVDFDDVPEYKAILTRLSLEELINMEGLVGGIQQKDDATLTTTLNTFASLLKDHQAQLENVDTVGLELAAPIIIKEQFSDPVNNMVEKIQQRLDDFSEVVDAIIDVIETLADLPARMDENVTTVLDGAADSLKEVLDSTITAISTAASTLTGSLKSSHDALMLNLDKFSPNGLLNAFAASDFEATGMDFFRSKLRSPGDDIAVFLNSKLTTQQIEMLANDGTDSESIVLEAFNGSLFDSNLNNQKPTAQASIHQKIAALNGADANTKSKYEAIADQLEKIGMPNKKYDKIRLNRLILEAMYPDQIKMSIQSLHPFIVQQVSRLYPEEVVATLDTTYDGVVNRIKAMPKTLIEDPLNDTYEEVKDTFENHFDIEGIFNVLQVKLDGMDEDLEFGLDRISFAFNQLIETLDARLAE